ncbi:MAG: cytochrome c1 [Alphaproteobacteria bacterium]|nr:cytochrome c1 [Alphaproteobacteria bacterium]
MRKITLVALAVSAIIGVGGIANASSETYNIKRHDWPQAGPFGKYDKASLQRGLQVYKEVCSACHSLNLVAFRDLKALGYSKPQIKAFAAGYDFPDGVDDNGDPKTRIGKPFDYFPAPFASEQEARDANNGALPPDFSLMAKSREHLSLFTPWDSVYGEDYIVGILTTFHDTPPKGYKLPAGTYYNETFPGNNIGMPPPLSDGLVEYADGTKATVEQMAEDVASFMSWAAEPKMEERKEMGLKVIIFMTILTILLYFVNKSVWRKIKKGDDLIEKDDESA